MRTGLYSLAELFGNRHIEQLVIPEIQRDYVWEKPQVEHLLGSILESFEAWRKEQISPSLKVVRSDSGPGERGGDGELFSLQQDFGKFHARRMHSTNVGFIYAYSDNDLPGQCFLIDGQQRLTTLYLALLATATGNEDLKERFRARYCLCSRESDGTNAVAPTRLDYRLREQTTQFLHQWVRHLLDAGDTPPPAKDQSWYLQRLDSDTTVKNLLENYETIRGLLVDALAAVGREGFYGYLEDLVECWYFDTNESAQGEELYLYLNARGESIADNENIKARLLATQGDAEKKDEWGRRWEEWQDYFWNKRNVGVSANMENPNADRGFNRFLSCIENLENLRASEGGSAEAIDLNTIKKYFEVLRWIEKEKEPFKADYSYTGWVDDWFREMWNILNQAESVDWAARLSDGSKSRALAWGSLLCVLSSLERSGGEMTAITRRRIFRSLRVIYLRFHNSFKAVSSLPETVNGLLGHTASAFSSLSTSTSEERCKWNYLFDKPDPDHQRLEEVIWKIEDHPLNRNGSDHGEVNLTHLVDLEGEVSLQKLEAIRDAFYDLFPLEKPASETTRKRVASVLLYYGPYWNRVGPWYLENYDLGDWRRTIRGRGSEEKSGGGPSVFRAFFEEFLQAKQSLDEFASMKTGSEPVNPETDKDLRKALIWYSEKLGPNFLRQGMHVELKTSEWWVHDVHFPGFCALWNTNGSFRRYSAFQKLSDQGIRHE
jgi:hypothetical protein